MASKSKDFRDGPELDHALPVGYEPGEGGQPCAIPEEIVDFSGHRSHTELADDPVAQELICRNFAKMGRIVAACAVSNVAPNTVKALMLKDPDFRARLQHAGQVYASRVLAEVQRRAIHGVTKPVFYKGEIVGTVQEYSDRLLEIELRRADPEVRAMLDGPKSQTTVNVNSSSVTNILATSPDALEAAQAALDPRTMSQGERDALRALMAARRATAHAGQLPPGDGAQASAGRDPGAIGQTNRPMLDVQAQERDHAATEPAGIAPEASNPPQDGRKP